MSFRSEQLPTLAGSSEIGLVACRDGERVALFSLPGLQERGEVALGVAPDVEVDLAFVGGKLLIAARTGDRTTLHLIDPQQLRALASTEIAGAARLLVCVGPQALLADKGGAAVVSVDGDRMSTVAMSVRSSPTCAAPLAAPRVVLNVGGHIETWDLHARRPLHRVKSDRPLTAQALGGTAQAIWFVPSARSSHVEVLPLGGRGAAWTRPVDGPVIAAAGAPGVEAIALASANEAPALLSMVGRDAAIVALAQPPAEALWMCDGASPLLVTAARGQPLRAWALSVKGASIVAEAGATTETVEPSGERPADRTGPTRIATQPAGEEPRMVLPRPAVSSVSDRLKEWRERLRPVPNVQAATTAARSSGSWRTMIAAWGRSQRGGVTAEPPPWDDASSLALASRRAELSMGAARGLALLYAAHLDGARGVARSDLARAVADDTAWDEGLGRGSLARGGLATWSRRWVALVPEVAAAIDELPPRHARLIAGPGSSLLTLAGPCAVIAASADERLEAAERAAAVLGATIAILDPSDAAPLALQLLEARLNGAVPLLPAPASTDAGWLDDLGVALIAVTADDVARIDLPMLFDSTEPATAREA